MRRSLFFFAITIIATGISLAQDSRSPISPFGMGIYPERYSPQELSQALQLAKEAGVRWTRVDMNWPNVEPEKGEFAWERWDAIIDSVSNHGIQMLGLLAYQPGWLSPNAPVTNEERALFANYVYEVVKRYKEKIHYWEIWNEPNGGSFWRPKSNVADYANLLIASYNEAKKADPQCVILAPGVSHIDRDFIRGIYEQGGGEFFDVLSVHPYSQAPDVTLVWDVNAAKSIMRTFGKEKAIWVTEVGWSTHAKGGVSEETQSANLVRAYLQSLALGIHNIMWYDFRDDGTDIFYSEHNFGILRRNLSPKPAYYALKTLTARLEGMVYRGDIFNPKGRLRGLLFSGKDKALLALWSVKGLREVTLNVGSKQVRIMDIFGNEAIVASPGGRLSLRLTEIPVYVEGFAEAALKIQPATSSRETMRWLLCGPFLSPEDKGLEVDYLQIAGGEAAVEPKEGESVVSEQAPKGKVQWNAYQTDEDGIADLTQVFTPNEDVVAYAFGDLWSDREREAVLNVSSDDGMKLWVNHQPLKGFSLVLTDHQHRKVDEGERLVVVKLVKGSNPVLLKIENRKGGWGFYLRVLGE